MMFDFFRSKTRDEFIEEGRRTYGLPEPKKVPQMPTNKELYRVGYNAVDKLTTLTLIGGNGFSMTLSLNQSGCEQMIRMLQSTYTQPLKDIE